MNKISLSGLFLSLFLFLLCSSSLAQDGFFSDAETLEPGVFALGAQPIIFTNPDDLWLTVRGAYGLKPGLSIHGKIGIDFNDDPYLGSHIEYRLIQQGSDAPVSVAILGGAQVLNNIGLKLSSVVSHRFEPFSLYGGLDYTPYFGERSLNAMVLPLGVDIPFANRNANFILEAMLPVSQDGEFFQGINFGVNYYFR